MHIFFIVLFHYGTSKKKKFEGESEKKTKIGTKLVISALKVICPEFQVIRGFSQKIPADLLSYDQINS